MGDAGGEDDTFGHRRADEGHLATGTRGGAALLGPGQPAPTESFQRLLRDLGVPCSMSQSGTVSENSAVVSFF
jgi:transposase InsO family protein